MCTYCTCLVAEGGQNARVTFSFCADPLPFPAFGRHLDFCGCSKVAVSSGKDVRNDPEYLLEKLGSFDFASVGGDGPGGKGLEALSELKQTLAKVYTVFSCVRRPYRFHFII